MAAKKKIMVNVSDFSEYPGPRYINQGPDSGEKFYQEILKKKFQESLKEGKLLEVVLDGTAGYASSFLDEAFGNLVYDFNMQKVKDNLQIVSSAEPEWKSIIENETMPQWEQRRKEKSVRRTSTAQK